MPAKKTSKKTKAVKKTKARGTKKAVRKAPPKPAKKPARKLTSKKMIGKRPAAPKPIGRVTHFYGGIKVAIVKFSKPVKKGTFVSFRGATTDFSQKLDSMQYDHKVIATAPKAKQIGVKVKKRVRPGDKVFPA